ncbi:exopolygalacturonase clone GBGA483-like [Pistacia vera]|uniref:exopolygalacturonase clone GBGA483-like n=1 Tax=Pistacia vera TaxID=55513 RepID=UPI001263BAC9|nr:exopolygalacturonase clone GBGA483-like [Pistacia vera]
MDFGAAADGENDDSKAFITAWKKACDWNGNSEVFVPQGKYLVNSVVFKGPCKGPISFIVKGFVKAPVDVSTFVDKESWITFERLSNFTLAGGGIFHGQGQIAWQQNDCQKNSKCQIPTSLRFNFLNDSTIKEIKSVDSKKVHINVFACYNLKLKSINISAPGDSPNTDGIHIGSSKGIEIYDSVIGTGDDCVSLSPGSESILVSNVFCGPGHGISVGSVGRTPNEKAISGLTVRNCTFTGTDNGVRIKTWPDSYEGVLSNFTFEDIVMNNVQNPIVIDQEYCPYKACNKKVPSKVKISNVKYNNIRGTSSSKVAINLLCSKLNPCQNVEIDDINLVYNDAKAAPATSSCSNVQAILKGNHIPITCV